MSTRLASVVSNASYFSVPAFANLARADADSTQLLTSSHLIIAQLTHHGRLLPSDWASMAPRGFIEPTAGPKPGIVGAPRSGLDAVRVAIWGAGSCDQRVRELVARLWPLYRRHPGFIFYSLSGAPEGEDRSAASYVAAAAAAEAAGAYAASAALFERAEEFSAPHPTYYGTAWVALGRVLLSSSALGGCS